MYLALQVLSEHRIFILQKTFPIQQLCLIPVSFPDIRALAPPLSLKEEILLPGQAAFIIG